MAGTEAWIKAGTSGGSLPTSPITINIDSNDIGATPDDTYNNIQGKIDTIPKVLNGITAEILLEPITYDIGGNKLRFADFQGGRIYIAPSASGNFTIQAVSSINFFNNNSIVEVNNLTKTGEGSVVVSNCINLSIFNSVFDNSSSAESGLEIVSSTIRVLFSSISINNATSVFEPILATDNSLAYLQDITLSSTGLNTKGVTSKNNSYVNYKNVTISGTLTSPTVPYGGGADALYLEFRFSGLLSANQFITNDGFFQAGLGFIGKTIPEDYTIESAEVRFDRVVSASAINIPIELRVHGTSIPTEPVITSGSLISTSVCGVPLGTNIYNFPASFNIGLDLSPYNGLQLTANIANFTLLGALIDGCLVTLKLTKNA